ncbi:MAG: hypothetical protein KAS67_06315 [Thermoplasmata archaeon]|nr:hypothetical protein [Thermoplasmata archaeon]
MAQIESHSSIHNISRVLNQEKTEGGEKSKTKNREERKIIEEKAKDIEERK